MKKLIIIVLIIALINLLITILLFNKSGVGRSFQLINSFPDTVVNKVRIDSVELSIKHLDSTIINYNTYEKEVIDNVLNLDDSTTVAKFYELIGSSSTGG
jgi:hypothetical protein